jgi:hypothetical protein
VGVEAVKFHESGNCCLWAESNTVALCSPPDPDHTASDFCSEATRPETERQRRLVRVVDGNRFESSARLKPWRRLPQ